MRRRRCVAGWLMLLLIGAAPSFAVNAAVPAIPANRLWQLAERDHRQTVQDSAVLHDADMQRHLRSVVSRLWQHVGVDLAAPVVEVIKETRIDAYTYPNGYILLTTGMLEQIDNEAQLAMVLAHELIHYARQHTVQLYVHLLSPDLNPIIAQRDVVEQVNKAEYQADREGLTIYKAAGYCTSALPRLFSNLIAGMEMRGASGALDEMIARRLRLQAMLDQTPTADTCLSASRDDHSFFLGCIAPALLANAQTAVQQGDWDLARRCLFDYMTVNSNSARAYYLQGEILRRRDGLDQVGHCTGYYETALKIDPQFSPAYLALGELYFKAGRLQEAKPYFETFLSLSPQYESRPFIEGYLRQCQK